ncbi:pantoate--beta-alanine ligase, partial [mine drainage metagenome]
MLETSIAGLRQSLSDARRQGKSVGFVATMGYLHAGHLALVEAAKAACGLVVVSIFVNPLQFAPGEDLARYPRDLERDLGMLSQAGVDIVFAPSEAEMYPEPMATIVSVP